MAYYCGWSSTAKVQVVSCLLSPLTHLLHNDISTYILPLHRPSITVHPIRSAVQQQGGIRYLDFLKVLVTLHWVLLKPHQPSPQGPPLTATLDISTLCAAQFLQLRITSLQTKSKCSSKAPFKKAFPLPLANKSSYSASSPV